MTNKNFKNLLTLWPVLIMGILTALSVSGQYPPGVIERLKDGETQTLRGVIRVPKAFGVVPRGPGSKEAGSPCGQFYIAALDPNKGNRLISTTSLELGRDDGEFYTCRYSFRLPANQRLYIVAGMGGALLLPKEDRSSVYISDAWIGGTNNKPRRGWERGFAGKYVTLGKIPAYLRFDLFYAQVDPN